MYVSSQLTYVPHPSRNDPCPDELDFLQFLSHFCSFVLPMWQHKFWTTAWVPGAFPIPHDPLDPGVLGQTHLKQTQLAGIYKCAYTLFQIQTPNQPCQRWENATWGHKAQATNHQNSTLLCYEFSRLVEVLSGTVFLLNLHFFEGNLCPFWESLHPFTQGGGRGPKAL